MGGPKGIPSAAFDVPEVNVSPSSSEQVYQGAGAPRVAPRPGSGSNADTPRVTATPSAKPVPGVAATAAGSASAAGASGTLGQGAPARPAAGAVPVGTAAAAPRKVRLTVARVDPWSVLKLSFLLSVAMGIGMVTASVILWEIINSMGVLDQINKMLQDIAGTGNGPKFDLYSYVGLGRVVSLSTFVAVINIIIIMALSTLGAFLYNIAATLVGGLHVTLSDD